LKFLSATVGELGGCFEEQKAIGRGCWGDAATSGIGDDRAVVHLGVEAQQGEGKSVLASGLTVAGTGVTSSGCKDRLDIDFEFRFQCRRRYQ
jgi:hypothetical protein